MQIVDVKVKMNYKVWKKKMKKMRYRMKIREYSMMTILIIYMQREI